MLGIQWEARLSSYLYGAYVPAGQDQQKTTKCILLGNENLYEENEPRQTQ